MKKFLLNTLLVTLIIVGFTGQSWAFASRHHGGGSQGSGNQGGSSSPHNPDNGLNPPGDGGNGSNPGSGDPGSGGPGSGNPGNNPDPIGPPEKNFPAAPVPEPMTLSLLGTGLAGIFLKRKIR